MSSMREVAAIPPIDAEERVGNGGVLTIDLAAIAGNYRLLSERASPAICGAVVKADAYGLGAAVVAPCLYRAGCRTFFVADVAEGLALRAVLAADAGITILHGAMPGEEPDCAAQRLTPVLNSLEQIAAWRGLARRLVRRLPAVIQVDSGMARMGLSAADSKRLAGDPALLDGIATRLVMSHLAVADDPAHPANEAQRVTFEDLRGLLPPAPASLAASSGIFLGGPFHFDLVRPGAALFGVAPQPGRPNPMRGVVRLQGRVVQVRDVPAGTSIGYGWTAQTDAPARLATIALGYADGFLRSLSNRGAAWFDGLRLPLMGRVSMDSIIVDVTALREGALVHGSLVDIVGAEQGVDDLAAAAGTIGYEILTGLGQRYRRRYVGSEGEAACAS